jgi:hypothetical protein
VSPADGLTRLGRAAVLGSCCLLLALTAHVLAGGAVPSVPALLVLTVPVACVCVLATGDRAGGYRIGLVLGATQVGLHEAFMATAQAHCAPAAMGHAAHLGAAAHGSVAQCWTAMPMASPSPAMVVGHLVAGMLTGLLLWHGERLLWAFLTWLAVTLPRGSVGRLLPGPARRAATAVRRTAHSVVPAGGVGRRGPPALLAA